MFRPGRWRGEKNRVKAVFKLQFHATQVSEVGAEGLVVSVVPADAGKPPVRSEKALVRDGRCQWESPIYERVIFTRELLTGKINRRIYRFVVSTGSGMAGSVGIVSVDLADYVGATKASPVSLPLKNSTNNAVLHVSIQKVEENAHQSGEEPSVDTNVKHEDRNSVSRSSNAEKDESKTEKNLPVFRFSLFHRDEKNKLIASQVALESMEYLSVQITKSNGYGRASSGSDLTLSTASESSSSGLNTPREVGTRHSKSDQQEPASFLYLMSYASPPQTEAHPKSYDGNGRPQWEWAFDQNATADDIKKEGSESEIERLRAELSSLTRKVDVSEMEIQTMRRQITKESRRGHELMKEVERLGKERDSLDEECRSLRVLKARLDESKNVNSEDDGDLRAALDEVRQELSYEKDVNMNLRLQLQKTQKSNEELILAVRDLDDMLEQKNREILEFSKRMEQPADGDEEDQTVLEEIVNEHREGKISTENESKLVDASKELEICRREKDELEMQMEQLALDYEILKQENHEIMYRLEQSELTEQLKGHCDCSLGYEIENRAEALEKELSDSVIMINKLRSHVKNLEEEFEANLEEITREKVEQEKRAIRAEETLRKMQFRNASTAQKLQEEFRRLSMQMASMFDENEKAAVRAMKEAGELRKEKKRIEELLMKAEEEVRLVRKSYDEKVAELESVKAETLRLREENGCVIEKLKESEDLRAEVGRLEGQIMESESMIKMGDEKRNELVEMVSTLNEEKEEKGEMIHRLETDLGILKGSVSGLEIEKEKLRNQVSQLKSELQKKEDSITRNEKKGVGRSAVSNGMRSPLRNTRSTAPVSPGNKELSSLKEKIKLLEGKIELKDAELKASASSFSKKEKDLQKTIEELEGRFSEHEQRTSAEERRDLEVLITESKTLKERNELMEMELKELQERFSEMSVKFAEVEGERQQLVMTLRSIKNPKNFLP